MTAFSRPAGVARLLAVIILVLGAAPDAARAQHQHEAPATAPKAGAAKGRAPGTSKAIPTSSVLANGTTVQRFVSKGVAVEFRIAPASAAAAAAAKGRIMEHDETVVRLKLTDVRTGRPISGAAPATWIDWREGDAPSTADACRQRVDGYVRANAYMEGALKSRAVVDLNSYFVLSLNKAASIAVLDPFLGFGRTKLYTTVPLRSVGESWTLSVDERRLYVTMPAVAQVAVVDTDNWKVLRNVDAGARPTRVSAQPGGRYLWVINEVADSTAGAGGVTVIDTRADTVVARIVTGHGAHTLAFSDDGASVALSNRAAGTVTVIDGTTLAVVKHVATGRDPVDVAYSAAGDAMYVVHEADGTIVVLDPRTGAVRTRISAKPGLHAVRFPPAIAGGHSNHGAGGAVARHLGFIVNPRENLVHVIDAKKREVVRTLEVKDGPDEVAFSGSFAYVRSSGSKDISMIPLDNPAAGGIGALDRFPVGNQPLGAAGPSAPAPTIVTAPDMPDAVYVMNAKERMIYYFHYMEGMPIPSGGLTTYGYEPKAIMVVGKDLHETAPGSYTATVKLNRRGDYDLVFMLPQPRVITCFSFPVVANPRLGAKQALLEVEPAESSRALSVGANVLRLKLSNPVTRELWKELKDARISLTAPGGWSTRALLRAGDDGLYEAAVTIPANGVYYMSIEIPSLGVGLRDRQPIILRAAGATGTSG